jgi:hypothetical protein
MFNISMGVDDSMTIIDSSEFTSIYGEAGSIFYLKALDYSDLYGTFLINDS